MRRRVQKIRDIKPDFVYNSVTVAKFVNHVMKEGKKSVATKIVNQVLEELKKKAKAEDVLAVFDLAINNVAPLVEVKSKRIGGANYTVPVEVRPERKLALAFRWLLDAARAKKGADMATRLCEEIFLASKNEGTAVKKRENVHRMAEANRAFAHFAM